MQGLTDSEPGARFGISALQVVSLIFYLPFVCSLFEPGSSVSMKLGLSR
jgi:hypothetical protein